MRELRVAAHDRGIFRGRSWSAALAVFVTGWYLYSVMGFSGRINASIGSQILFVQAIAAFALALSAVTTTADSISREKRDGTLGLLFLTPLKGRDVVLGKLVSSTAFWFSSALATLPILALPMLLGGIQLSQSLNLFASILNTMLFSASVGLFVSSLSVQRQKAHSVAVGIVFFFAGFIPLMVAMGRKLPLSPGSLHTLEMASPYYAQRLSLGAPIGLERYYFFASLAFVFLLSCCFLIAASWLTPRTWQQRAREPMIVRARNRFNRKTGQTINSRSDLGRKLLDRNAYEWLAARDKSASTSAWTFTLGWIAIAAVFLAIYGRRYPDGAFILVCVPVACLLQLGLKIRAGGHACDCFVRDQSSGAMELILSTPMTIPKMVAGEFAALRRHFLWLFVFTSFLMFLSWYLSFGGIDHLSSLFFPEGGPSPMRFRAFVITLALVFLLWLDSLALIWTAMWCALRSLLNPRGTAVSLTLGSPVILFVMIMPMILNSSSARRMVSEAGFYVGAALLLALVICVDVVLILRCRKKVLKRGREAASTPLVHSRDLPSLFSSVLSVFLRNRNRARGAPPAPVRN